VERSFLLNSLFCALYVGSHLRRLKEVECSLGHLMLIGNDRLPLVSPTPKKKRRKFRSLYFSSSKALRRSRMTRSKKTVSKVGDASFGEPRRNLRFRGGGSTGDDNASV
jgi:hypothetical protein